MPRDILILRDPRESPKKCSLTPLRGLEGVQFRLYHPDRRVPAGNRILLHHEGDELKPSDAHRPLLLIDCAWRRLPQLLATLEGPFEKRRLPPLRTAYPRRSTLFADPATGLASVEALYAVRALLGDPDPELLRGYRWAQEFHERNPSLP